MKNFSTITSKRLTDICLIFSEEVLKLITKNNIKLKDINEENLKKIINLEEQAFLTTSKRVKLTKKELYGFTLSIIKRILMVNFDDGEKK